MTNPTYVQLSNEDLNKLVSFSSELLSGFNDFMNTTLKCLRDFFDYSISSYTVFDDDEEEKRYVKNIVSNFFNKRDTESYQHSGYLTDISYLNRDLYRAANPSKYIFVREYSEESGDAGMFYNVLKRYGITKQILIGAHVSASAPVHVLSIYKTSSNDHISDYEMTLLDAIGKIFCETVNMYKDYAVLKRTSLLYYQYINAERKGIAFFSPKESLLTYNHVFRMYRDQIFPDKSMRSFVNALLAADMSIKDPMAQNPFSGYQIRVDVKNPDLSDLNSPYYFITLTEQAEHYSQAPAIRSIYLKNHLTMREIEIANLIEKGLNNKEISVKLFISIATVKTHVKNIFSKLEVSSRRDFFELIQNGDQ